MFTDATSITIGTIVLALGCLPLCAHMLFRERVIRQSVYNTSRFPLFAARDRLFQLLRNGKMKEADIAWSATYRTVTTMLGLRKKRDLVSAITANIRFRVQLVKDERLHVEYEKLLLELAESVERVPEFGEVLGAVDRAHVEMLAERTNRAILMFYLWALKKLGMTASRLHQGMAGAQRFSEMLRAQGRSVAVFESRNEDRQPVGV